MTSVRVRCLCLAAVAIGIAATGAHAAAPPLTQRLLKANELDGLRPLAPATATTDTFQWAAGEGPGDVTSEENWLKEAGFVAGAAERLTAPDLTSRGAISFVIQFRTANGARADLSHEIAAQGAPLGWKLRSFPVAGIPGAYGIAKGSPGGDWYYKVYFVSGRFSYGVVAYGLRSTAGPSAAQVTNAARRLFRRVNA